MTAEVKLVPAVRWLTTAVYWALVTALGMSIVGLVLAVAGVFYPILLLALGVPSSIGLGVWGWHPFRRAAGELISGGIISTAAVLVVIVASMSSAALFSGEHMQTNRDPGVYLTTGRWLADEGTLLVSGKVGGFAGFEELTAESPGYYEVRDDGTVDPQFLHLLPAWGAAAHWLGGDQMLLRTNVVVIALALGALWLFAATVMRPWFAVLAMTSVAVVLPTVHFARDLYTEPLALLFVFSGLAFLAFAHRAVHPGLSAIAGLMVGAVAMVRIDGWLAVIAVVAYLMTVRWQAHEEGTETMISHFIHPALLGILIAGSVGLIDGMVRSRPYLVGRASHFASMLGLLVVIVVIGLVAFRWPGLFRRIAGWLDRNRSTVAWLIPVAVVVVAATFFFIRPLLEVHAPNVDPSIETLQQLEGLPVDGTRTYFEWSMHWLSWYLGVFALTLGVIGFAWAWRRAILGLRELWPFLLTMSLTTAVFVLRPSITPDQLWAMRRFVPIVLPGLIVAAVLATQWAFQRTTHRPLRWGALAAAVGILIAVPASFTWPLRTSTSYVGMYNAIEEVCDAIPAESAVLLTTRFAGRFQAPVRSFCNVTVSGIIDPSADPTCLVVAVNQAWADRGVDLIIGYGDELELEPQVSVNTTYDIPEITLTRRPVELTTSVFAINLADADALDPSGCTA